MRRSFIGVALASTIIFSGGITNVYADSPVADITPTEIYNDTPLGFDNKIEIEKKYKTDFLYVIDKEKYKDIVSKDTALFIIKDRLLIVDSKELTDEDLDSIKSTKEIYVIGELENELKHLEEEENFRAQVLSENKVEVAMKLIEEDGLKKDIVIANGNSIADSLTGIQISKLKNASLILIEDEIPEVVEEFLKEYGNEKNISFIEGEKMIEDEVKKEILKLAGNSRYEINTSDFIKSGLIPKKEEDSKEDVSIEETTSESSNDNIQSNELKTTDENSLISGLNPKMMNSIKNTANRSIEESKDTLNAKEKIISLEIIEEEEELSNIITNDYVEVVENDKTKVENIIEKANNDDISAHKLSLIHNSPIDKDTLKSLKEENDNYYIVPMEANEEIVERVMNGEYGNGTHRKEELSLDGYDYDEVQKEIQAFVDKKAEEERQAAEELQRQIIEAQEAERQAAVETQTANYNSSNSVSYNTSTNHSHQTHQVGQTEQSSANVESFISALTSMQGWTYSQSQRMQVGYADCSSIIIRAMISSGTTSNTANLTTRSISGDSRFYEIPMSQIKRGDILWAPGHVEVFMGGNTTFGAFKPGKPAGYASGVNRFSKAYRINGF